MFCIHCGSSNPDHGKYCYKCGQPVVGSGVASRAHCPVSAHHRRLTEQELLAGLTNIDPKPNQCHKCGETTELTRHKFGMAKVVSRDWSGTIGSVATTAISLSLAPILGGGFFAFRRPDKQLSVLHAELVMCEDCRQGCRNFWGDFKLTARDYVCHPWTAEAARIGYKRLLSADELSRLIPSPPSATRGG